MHACRSIALAALLVTGLHAGVSGQLASRPTEDWIKLLDAPDRVKSLRVDEVVGRLNLRAGDVVADLGAGTGVFSLPIARAVGTGRVYAVEVDRGLVDYIGAKAAKEKAGNVQAVLGQFGDPALPARDVDVAFFHDALHHIEDRTGYLARLASYLKPAARIAVVEMDPVTGAHRNDPALQITKAQLDGWMKTLGFMREQVTDLPDGKWFASYARKP